MAYTTLKSLFTGICDAIRTKKGTTDLINHQDIPSEILNLPSVDVSGVTATASDVLSPKIFVDANGKETPGSMPTVSTLTTLIASAYNGTLHIAVRPDQKGYLKGQMFSSLDDANFLPENIKSDVSIFGMSGTLESGYKTIAINCIPTSSFSYGYYNHTWTISNPNLTKKPKDFFLMSPMVYSGNVIGIRCMNNVTGYYITDWYTNTSSPYITTSFETGKLTINLMSCTSSITTSYTWQGYAFI